MSLNSTSISTEERSFADLIDRISSQSFKDWYQERRYVENIRKGQPYFNGPSSVPDARSHSPSKFIQCHRKTYYNQLNAPREDEEPAGIFWFGTKFETEIILPYLREIADSDQYVQNSKWVDFTVDSRQGELRIRGETDPTIVDSDGEPWIVTEIKSKQSVRHLESPDERHRAQVHAYMYGLSQQVEERKITDAIIIYGGRKTFNLKAFHVEFDPWFWRERVLDWAAAHTEYRLDEQLPLASPESSWECDYCSYKNRCGKGDSSYQNSSPLGFLPLFEYPRGAVEDHLQAYPDKLGLTPTLAFQHPELAEEVEVYDWQCVACDETVSWDEISWDGNPEEPPECQKCGVPGALRGPALSEQVSDQGP